MPHGVVFESTTTFDSRLDKDYIEKSYAQLNELLKENPEWRSMRCEMKMEEYVDGKAKVHIAISDPHALDPTLIILGVLALLGCAWLFFS